MTKPSNEAAVDTPERLVRVIPEIDRSLLEKEIQGLNAKLNWTHIAEPLKDVYRLRITELQEKLKVST
jgi:hypothetical protein